ncbi:MAG: hydrogenase-4 component G [Campylobacter sp.]|nr:hydrogenase-4 component G [Campylobacter sp.]
MQISQNVGLYQRENPQALQGSSNNGSSKVPQETISHVNAKDVSNSYFLQFQTQSFTSSISNFSAQSSISSLFGQNTQNIPENLTEILNGIDFDAIGYDGKAISSLNTDEASELIGDNGFFGVTNTAERIANFVISAAGDDTQKLQAGRDGILQGFKDAQKLWGGELPEISQRTIDKTLESIDKKIAELGGNILNLSA